MQTQEMEWIIPPDVAPPPARPQYPTPPQYPPPPQPPYPLGGPPPPTPPSDPPSHGLAGVVAIAVVAFILALVGVQHLRATPDATSIFNPANPVATAPPAADVTGTSSLSPSEVSSIAAKVDKGVVNIDTTLDFGTGRAAGTGMVITATGEVLTNNHVIDGATKITATVVDTGKSYTAHVVGTDPTDDVAVIQLENASNLKTISTAKLSTVAVGDPVVAVGNAGGKGGTPSVATGSVTDLNQSITASEQDGSNAQRLSGLIEVDAPIEAGDSGGPLANRNGDVIGMDSAAEVSGRFRSTTTTAGYAIPIEKALSIASQVQSGNGSSTIHVGLPAFLGVQLSGRTFSSTDGALIVGVERGTPAASIGLSAGDTITSVNGRSIGSANELRSALQSHKPGEQVTIGWTDQSGSPHTAKATLIAGPAD